MVLHQPVGLSAIAGVAAHELGHACGLLHAAGFEGARSDVERAPAIAEYGDRSSTMGNDLHTSNAFTAPAQYYLGVLSDAEVATNLSTSVLLRDLYDVGGEWYEPTSLAAALPCSWCRSLKSSASSATVGGELWMTFRSDASTCPSHARDLPMGLDCVDDRASHHNSVHIHYAMNSQYPGTEEWVVMRARESWRASTYSSRPHDAREIVVHICDIAVGERVAEVTVGRTEMEARGKCEGIASRARTRRFLFTGRVQLATAANWTRATAVVRLLREDRFEVVRVQTASHTPCVRWRGDGLSTAVEASTCASTEGWSSHQCNVSVRPSNHTACDSNLNNLNNLSLATLYDVEVTTVYNTSALDVSHNASSVAWDADAGFATTDARVVARFAVNRTTNVSDVVRLFALGVASAFDVDVSRIRVDVREDSWSRNNYARARRVVIRSEDTPSVLVVVVFVLVVALTLTSVVTTVFCGCLLLVKPTRVRTHVQLRDDT